MYENKAIKVSVEVAKNFLKMALEDFEKGNQDKALSLINDAQDKLQNTLDLIELNAERAGEL